MASHVNCIDSNATNMQGGSKTAPLMTAGQISFRAFRKQQQHF